MDIQPMLRTKIPDSRRKQKQSEKQAKEIIRGSKHESMKFGSKLWTSDRQKEERVPNKKNGESVKKLYRIVYPSSSFK